MDSPGSLSITTTPLFSSCSSLGQREDCQNMNSEAESEITINSYSDARSSDISPLRSSYSTDDTSCCTFLDKDLWEKKHSFFKQLNHYFNEIGEVEKRIGIVNISKNIEEFIAKTNKLPPSSWALVSSREDTNLVAKTSSSSSSEGLGVMKYLTNFRKDNEDETSRIKMEAFKKRWVMTPEEKVWFSSTDLEEFGYPTLKNNILSEEESEVINSTTDSCSVSKKKEISFDDLIAQIDFNTPGPSRLQKGMRQTFPVSTTSGIPHTMNTRMTWPWRRTPNEEQRQRSLLHRMYDFLLCRKRVLRERFNSENQNHHHNLKQQKDFPSNNYSYRFSHRGNHSCQLVI